MTDLFYDNLYLSYRNILYTTIANLSSDNLLMQIFRSEYFISFLYVLFYKLIVSS